MTIRGIDAIQFPRDIDSNAANMIKGLCTAGKLNQFRINMMT